MPLKQQPSTTPRAFAPSSVRAVADRLRKAGDTEASDLIAYLQRQLSANGVVCCQGCGCTQGDCAQCVAKTGAPCSWVTQTKCSACAPTKRAPLTKMTMRSKKAG